MFIPDPGSNFYHPGSRLDNIPDPRSGSASKNWICFFSIPDSGVKKHRIPDPDSQHWWICIVLPYPGMNF
jgi:hypothetical protein